MQIIQNVLIIFKNQNGHSIFKVIFESTNATNAKEMIQLIKNLIKIVTDCGYNTIKNLQEYDIDQLLLIKNHETKLKILWKFIQYWEVISLKDNQVLLVKFMKIPELKVLIYAKENRTVDFKTEFDGLILKLKGKYEEKIINYKCKAIARIASENLNQDILDYLISNQNLDLQLRLLVVLQVCRAGLNKTLKKFCKMEKSSDVDDNMALKIMHEIIRAIMMQKDKRNYKNILNPIVDHEQCFNIFFNYKKDIAVKFVKQATEAEYDDVILLIFKSGHYIGTKDGSYFLTDCITEDSFRKILDNCVTLDKYDQTLKCLKIDYRFLYPANEFANFNSIGKKLLMTTFLLTTGIINHFVLWTLLFLYHNREDTYNWMNEWNAWVGFFIYPTVMLVTVMFYIVDKSSDYMKRESLFDVVVIACSTILPFALYSEHQDIIDVFCPIVLILSLNEFVLTLMLLVDPKVRQAKFENAVQLIYENKNLSNAIDHPVMETYIVVMNRAFRSYNRWNFGVFVISLILMLVGVWTSYYVHHWSSVFLFSLCPIIVTIREFLQLLLFGKSYFKSVVNVIEFSMIISGFLGILYIDRENRSIFHVATAIFIICSVLELIFLWSKLWKYILITMSMFVKVTVMYAKLIFIFGSLLVGFSFSFILIYAPKLSEIKRNSTIHKRQWMLENGTYDGLPLNNFQDFRHSFLKVLIMLTGEFDASDLSLESWYKFLFFTMFVFMAITIFNFMNALAIGEVEDLRKDAEFFVLNEKLKLICSQKDFTFRIKIFLRTYKKINDFFNFWEINKLLSSRNSTASETRVMYVDCEKMVVSTSPKFEPESRIGTIEKDLCDKLLALS